MTCDDLTRDELDEAREQGSAMDILGQFPPQFIARRARVSPDHLMRDAGDNPWPALEGVVGVFFTSRSGSTALARTAQEHFQVQQVEESFNSPALERRAQKWGLDNFQAVAKRFVARTSPAGWFMFKAGGPGVVNAARMGFLDSHACILHPILLLRRDIVGQALSNFAARHTRQYHSNQVAQSQLTEADYDGDRIRRMINVIHDGNQRLSRIVQGFVHRPRLVIYEDYRDGDMTAPLAVLGATGLPHRSSPMSHRVNVTRNTHPLTARFRDRFLNEASPETHEMIARHDAFVDEWVARRQQTGDLARPLVTRAGNG